MSGVVDARKNRRDGGGSPQKMQNNTQRPERTDKG